MGLFQMKDYYIRFIADNTSALAALKNGEVDMLDYNYQCKPIFHLLILHGAKSLTYKA